MITDQMIKAAVSSFISNAHHGRYAAMEQALTAALQGSVVVPQAEWDNLQTILGKLDDQICATKDILTAAKMASQVSRQDGDTTTGGV